jgi:hypothetical protein
MAELRRERERGGKIDGPTQNGKRRKHRRS